MLPRHGVLGSTSYLSLSPRSFRPALPLASCRWSSLPSGMSLRPDYPSRLDALSEVSSARRGATPEPDSADVDLHAATLPFSTPFHSHAALPPVYASPFPSSAPPHQETFFTPPARIPHRSPPATWPRWEPHLRASRPSAYGQCLTYGEDGDGRREHKAKREPPLRRHVCPVCDKRFNRPSSLSTHMSVHTGAKPYQCKREGCGRRFSVSSNLRRHERTHEARDGPLSSPTPPHGAAYNLPYPSVYLRPFGTTHDGPVHGYALDADRMPFCEPYTPAHEHALPPFRHLMMSSV
ncbi:hypothetical protein Q5752_003844 [Cryptotrichosporon argae]